MKEFQVKNPNYGTGPTGGLPIQVGSFVYVDKSGPDGKPDGFIDKYDKEILYGNTNPIYLGLNLGATWKNLSIEATFTGKLKNPKNFGAIVDYHDGSKQVYNTEWLTDSWTPENTDAYFPRLKSYIAEGGKDLAINQTRYLQNAAYLRIKNITIGYTLPKKFTMKAKLERVRLYLTGDNIFEFTKLSKNYDPEILGTSHPMQRLFTFGLNLSF